MKTLPLLALLALLTGCATEPPAFDVLITEPSGNIGSLDGYLTGHWSCDSTVDPATRYLGTQDALWTGVTGAPRVGSLRIRAECPPGALLTVQVGASAVALRPTELRCEVFAADGQRVASESVVRGGGASDPICRVIVPD